jgi:hypothetical protein
MDSEHRFHEDGIFNMQYWEVLLPFFSFFYNQFLNKRFLINYKFYQILIIKIYFNRMIYDFIEIYIKNISFNELLQYSVS